MQKKYCIREIEVNLQFFSGEKTEKATPKKREDLRKKGQVVQSKDINSALSMLFVFLVINFIHKTVFSTFFKFYHYCMSSLSDTKSDFFINDFQVLFLEAIKIIAILSLPFLFTALLVGIVTSYAQVGFLFTVEPIKFKLDKLSVLKGLKRMFSTKSFVEMVKSILKIVIVLYYSYIYITSRSNDLMNLLNLDLSQSVYIIWDIIYNVIINISIMLFVLAILDYAYKYWQNEKEIMMSKQDIKDEYKQTEGDPFIKGKIKEKQRQMAMSRMMQEVKDADVVITNPTHFAVALKYDKLKFQAPKVVAKGVDLVAQNIKKIAKENDVVIVENKPLAQSLYKNVEIGETILQEHFEAVADVLAYVYKLKNRSIQ